MQPRRNNATVLSATLALLALSACGGTWIDDPKNFKRVFDFEQPPDVRVIHSYYWKSPHWTVEYRYYLALQPSPKFVNGLTDASLMTPALPDQKRIDSCGDKRPPWFLPKPLDSYRAWIPKTDAAYSVFLDKKDGTLFLCDQRL